MRALDRLSPLPPFIRQAFRVEVPLWHKLEDGIADPPLNDQTAPNHSPARETPADKGPSPRSSGNATKSPDARTESAEETADEEAAEEESYVPATGQGCFSFEMSLLQRAAQTFAKRSVADHYLQVARWLHTGLATTISRKSWHLLSKHRAYTIAPLALLRVHFKLGYLSTEKSDRKKPYAATDAQKPDCARLGMAHQPSHACGLSGKDLSLPHPEVPNLGMSNIPKAKTEKLVLRLTSFA